MRSNKRPDGRETFLRRARREQLVGCAVEALAELGFTGTSVAEVARRAGVAKSVVLYHFASAAELMEAVVAHVYADAAGPLEAALAAATTARDRLAAYVRGCVEFAWTHRTETAAVAEVFANLRDAQGRLRYGPEGNTELVGFVAGLLRDGQRTGEFGAFDADALALVIRATVDALPAAFAGDRTAAGPELADRLVTVFDLTTRPDERSTR